MNLVCPNKSSEDWKNLVDRVGSEEKAYESYYKNGMEIPIFSPRRSDIESNQELNNKLQPFFDKIRVSIKEVSSIKDENGEAIGAIAASNLLHKSIEVVKGEAKIDTLPEEAGHFFTQILKNNKSPLYDSMVNEIKDYDVYKDVIAQYSDVYKGNQEKLADEAIGKLIGQQIVDKFEQQEKAPRANRWWNRVINYLKEKLGLVDKEGLENIIVRNDPFEEASDRILGRYGYNGIHLDDSPENQEVYYQLKDAKSIERRILEKFPLLEEKNGRYTIEEDGKQREIKNTVSDKVENYLKGTRGDRRTAEEKQIQLDKAKWAGKGHQDLDNIISRLVGERDGKLAPAKVVTTNDVIYNKLNSYAKEFINSLSPDSRILTNVPLYNKKADLATKADMLVIDANGKVHVYDWKFLEFGRDKKLSDFKEKLNQIKISNIKSILRDSYGINDFGKIRNIPFDVSYSKGNINSLQTGPVDMNVELDKHLRPIPLNEEMTGDEKLDRIIQTQLDKVNEIEKSKPLSSATEDEKETFDLNKEAKLGRIKQAIRDIQLKQDLRQYVSIGLNAINDLATTPINQYSQEQLQNLAKTMDFYGQDMLGLIKDKVKDFTDAEKADLNRLVVESQMYSSELKTAIGEKLLETTDPSILEAQPNIGYIAKIFRSISQQNHPIIKHFWNNLVLPAKAQTREAVDKLNNKIKDSLEGLKKILPNKTMGDLFDFMIDKGKDGKLKIVGKYKDEVYKSLEDARAKIREGISDEKLKAMEFIKKHGEFDHDAYNEKFDALKKKLDKIYKNDVDRDEKISNRIKSFRYQNDNEFGLGNSYNPFFKLNEDSKLFSDKYNKIQSTPEMKNFYDLWMKHSKEFQENINQKSLGSRFLWNVRSNFIDSLRENGWGAFTNLNSVLDELKAKNTQELGMVDSTTGLPTYEIPAYYTNDSMIQDKNGNWIHDSDNQSKDLGRVLSLVGAMAYNHKFMSDIEGDSKALGILMQNQESIQVDGNGNPIKNQLTGQLQKVVGSATNLEMFRDYMNYYVYGIKNKTKDYKLGEFSTLAIFNKAQSWFVGKALIANPASIMAHLVRSKLNIAILAGTEKFFNKGEYNKSLMQFASRDQKSMQLLSYFDLQHGENFYRKAEELSTGFLSDYATYDKMFIGHDATDRMIRNVTLMSLMKSHTYDAEQNKIVKMNSDRTGTSLYNQIDLSGKNIDFKGIPKEALESFRNKALTIGNTALGINSRDDIRLINLVVGGRALMTFRNWIPNMVYARYGDLRFDEGLDAYELGRYRTFWNNIVSKQFIPNILDGIKRFGTFGYGGKFGDSVIRTAKEAYQKELEKNPNLKMTEEEYIDLHLANMRGNMMETYIVAALIASMMAVQPDKDKHEHLEQGSARKWYQKTLERAMQDISFFYSPNEFNKQLKSPVPMVNTYSSLLSFGKAYLDKGEEVITGQPIKGTRKNEFRKANLEMIPGLAGYESLQNYIDPNYNDVEGKENQPAK